MPNKIQVITIGSATEDLIVLTSEGRILPGESATCEKLLAFEYGAKIPVGRIQNSPGGAGANVAIGLSKLGVNAQANVAVGGDEIGENLKKYLEKSGVDASLCQTVHEYPSDRSVILVEPLDRDRTIFYNREAGRKLKLKDISKWKAEWVFVSSLTDGWENKLGQILKLRKEKGVRIAWNPGRTQIQAGIKFLSPLLAETSVLFLNWDEALELALSDKDFKNAYNHKKSTKKAVIKFLQNIGSGIVVITLGRKGSIATDGYYYLKAPSFSPKRVELTGAGDAYTSGFLASWINEPGNLKRAMSWGMANSGSVVLYFGAEKGLLTLAQIKRKINEVIMDAVIEERRL
ncbi:MAG: carbohydrate kinase family protein [Candidatus Moraniibacteriota bacterium]